MQDARFGTPPVRTSVPRSPVTRMDDHEPLDHMFSGISDAQLDESREVKVRIPVSHLIRLHGIKIVNGRGISETITDALAVYFRVLEEDRAAARSNKT